MAPLKEKVCQYHNGEDWRYLQASIGIIEHFQTTRLNSLEHRN